jgi:hypothetical protein
MASTKRIVRSDKLLQDKELASIILRLMMAVNDGALANDALSEWDQTTERQKKNRFHGGRMYFARMQLGHVFEALDMVVEISKSAKLRELVAGSDSDTQESFDKLVAFLDTDDHKIMARIRSNLSFHYDGKLAVRCLEDFLKKKPDDFSAMTFGTETLDWYFQLADKITNSIFAREVLKIPDDSDVTAEANKIFHRLFDVHEALADFAMHFIRHYFSR